MSITSSSLLIGQERFPSDVCVGCANKRMKSGWSRHKQTLDGYRVILSRKTKKFNQIPQVLALRLGELGSLFHQKRMKLYVLLLMLSLPTLSQADCTAQCLRCAQQISNLDPAFNRMTCTLQCKGWSSSSGTQVGCEKILETLSEDEDQSDEDPKTPSNPVKRYGGFIKRIDKNKNKYAPWKENVVLKGLFPKMYGDSLPKLSERDVPSITGEEEGEDVTAEHQTGLYDTELPLNEVKRYGGFLRKFGPKRSAEDDEVRQGMQKRYGGFMRRIRPKLRWDNQKRYGGFLRRHFKISVRSDEEPPSYEDYGLK